jgi:hypothetical protein
LATLEAGADWRESKGTLKECYPGTVYCQIIIVVTKGGFNDPHGRLITANNDLRKFFQDTGIYRKGGSPVSTEHLDELPVEGFRLDVQPTGIRILAADTEGIRRGLCFLEEQLLGADGPFLPIGVIERQPWLKNRISLCFFGPIK